jgi:HlyD family secretion protein
MANMTPEERQAFMDRMRARGFDPEAMMAGRGGRGGAGAANNAPNATPNGAQQRSGQPAGGGRGQSPSQGAQGVAARASTATTIDALFGPLPPTESFGQTWRDLNGKLVRVPLRLGITDGTQTQLIQGDLKEGDDVVTSVITAAQRAATNAGSTAFPGFQQNRGGGGGFPGGGGGQRGGGGAPRGGR